MSTSRVVPVLSNSSAIALRVLGASGSLTAFALPAFALGATLTAFALTALAFALGATLTAFALTAFTLVFIVCLAPLPDVGECLTRQPLTSYSSSVF